MLTPSSFRSTPSVSSSGGGVLPRKTSSMHPVQYDDYDSKKRYVVASGYVALCLVLLP
jgi:hypothetical protein